MRFVSLHLKNFQCHEDLEVRFGPDLTTIKGPTDIGKSSILRALRWVCQNDIAGDDFIKEGANTTIVSLTVRHNKRNHNIERVKGSNRNEYWLDGQVYRAFGQAVPDDIAKLLNVNDVNFQGQHDAPYWFSETAGEVSRRLNSIIDLSVIDESLSQVSQLVRQASDRKTISAERLNQAKREYEELEPQRQRITEFGELKKQGKELDTLEENQSRLAGLISSIRTNCDSYQTRSAQAEEGRTVLDAATRAIKLSTNAVKLEGLILEIRLARSYITRSIQHTKEAEYKFHKRIKGERCPICQNRLQ